MPLLNFGLLLAERGAPAFDYTNEDFEADVGTVRRFVVQKNEIELSSCPTQHP